MRSVRAALAIRFFKIAPQGNVNVLLQTSVILIFFKKTKNYLQITNLNFYVYQRKKIIATNYYSKTTKQNQLKDSLKGNLFLHLKPQ